MKSTYLNRINKKGTYEIVNKRTGEVIETFRLSSSANIRLMQLNDPDLRIRKVK